jgi:hypothetical protein
MGMQTPIGIHVAVVPIVFFNFKLPQCNCTPVDSTAIVHIVFELAS